MKKLVSASRNKRPPIKKPKMNAARENVNQKLFKDKSDGSRKSTGT